MKSRSISIVQCLLASNAKSCICFVYHNCLLCLSQWTNTRDTWKLVQTSKPNTYPHCIYSILYIPIYHINVLLHPPLTFAPFYSTQYFHVYRICINRLLKSIAWFCFCHGIGGVAVIIDPSNFYEFPSLVRLSKIYYVNH